MTIHVLSPFQSMVRTFNMSIGAKPDKELRIKLIQEEAQEFIDGVKVRNVVEVIDALCDLLYVTYGAADVFKAGALTDDKYENWPVKLDRPNWHSLNAELEDFNYTINDAVNALLIGDPRKIHIELQLLAEGLWQCAAEGVGVDLKPFFKEVHRTNMRKLRGPIRADGKQLKPADWKPPRLEEMYLRLTSGKDPCCNVIAPIRAKEHEFDLAFRVEDPNGGYMCGHCGGVFVEYELDYSEDYKRGKHEQSSAHG